MTYTTTKHDGSKPAFTIEAIIPFSDPLTKILGRDRDGWNGETKSGLRFWIRSQVNNSPPSNWTLTAAFHIDEPDAAQIERIAAEIQVALDAETKILRALQRRIHLLSYDK